MSFDLSFPKKLMQLSGFSSGSAPGPDNYVLRFRADVGYSIDHWPNENPPTIAEIEAVDISADLLAAKQAAKQAELDAAWASHPGTEITLQDATTFRLPITKAEVTVNRLEALTASLEQRAAIVFDSNAQPRTIPLAELAATVGAFQAGINALFASYYTLQAMIASATEETIDAITVEL